METFNPWVLEAPPCPEGHSPAHVYLWHPDTTLKWYCRLCQRRFDCPDPKKRKRKVIREVVTARDLSKYPKLQEVVKPKR